MSDTQSEPGDNLILFPTPAGAQGQPAPVVLDGELLTEQDNPAGVGQVTGLVVWVLMLARGVGTAPRLVQARAVVAYRLRKAPRDVARLGWFVLRGHSRWIAKGWTWVSHGHLRADARAAWLAGDSETRRKAQELIRADARARWAKLGIAAHRITFGALLVTFLGGVLALIDSQVSRVDMWPWLAGVYTVLGVLGAAALWVLKALPLGWLVAASWEGRDKTPGAGWLVRPTRDDADSWIDERMISQALAHLGISPLDRFFKAGGELVYTVPARVDGEGTYAQIRLPMGATADMVAAKRTTLAANLGRATLETWPTQGEEAGILELWIADKGKLGGGAGPWPLLDEGRVDVFEGVPIGKTQRGQLIYGHFFERNWIVGGRPGQGKTALVRILVLGAALDPTAELWVFVIAQNTDFKPFAPRLSRYQVGMGPDVAAAAVQALADLFAEMERRENCWPPCPGAPRPPPGAWPTNPPWGCIR
jgi:S-DNA-T family DNA segregation ATPase FtsK/SpoIIIE